MELASFTIEFFEHVPPGSLKSWLTLFSNRGASKNAILTASFGSSVLSQNKFVLWDSGYSAPLCRGSAK